MSNEGSRNNLNNNFRKAVAGVVKWIGAIVAALLVGFLTWQARAIQEIGQRVERLEVRVNQNEGTTDTNSQWIRDWYNELRVPERDQKQDDSIKGLRELTAGFDGRLRSLEKDFAGLGGPKDPLFGMCVALDKRIRALEAKVK